MYTQKDFQYWLAKKGIKISPWQVSLAMEFMETVRYDHRNIKSDYSSIIIGQVKDFLRSKDDAETT